MTVVAKSRIRQFIREVNKEKKTTVILTTHDMDDIEQICDRLIMIDRGRIIYDGSLASFKEKYSGGYMLTIELANENTNIVENRFKIIKEEGPKKRILFDKKEISVAEAITLITRSYDITDLTLKEPNIEEIVKRIYENNSMSESVVYSRGE